jgi:hypothetical protein
MAVGLGSEEAAEAFVADQRFAALAQLLFQSGKGGFARGSIVARFTTWSTPCMGLSVSSGFHRRP